MTLSVKIEMKKLICLILILSFAFALFACNAPAESETTDNGNSNQTTETTESEEKTTIEGSNADTQEATTTATTTNVTTDDTDGSHDLTTESDNKDSVDTTETDADNTIDKNLAIQYLVELLNEYKMSPASFIPESMRPENASVSLSNLDFSSSVAISDIPKGGFGEQWNMIANNLVQADIFFDTLSIVDGLATTSVTLFQQYLDVNPADTASYSFESGTYSVTINIDNDSIYYVIEYIAITTEEETETDGTPAEPEITETKFQIALSMNLDTKEKTVRVQLGDDNALRYVITDNSYTLSIKYLGVRATYFTVSENEDGSVSGHIQEYIKISELNVASIAEFYIYDDYVIVTGDKADGIPGFSGYICEVYDTSSGKLIGYEVKETLSTIVYNTVWFHLDDVNGINSVKYAEDINDDNKQKFFVNESNKPWENKLVGGLSGKMLSRRFDIEFRTQYFYVYNEETEAYEEIKLQIPMLFVQEEYLEDLEKDVKSKNDINISIALSDTLLNKVMDSYDTYVDTLIINSSAITYDAIIDYIGNAVEFE